MKFINPKGILIMLHKPHPSHIMKHEQLYGKVLGLKGHISYEGATGKQLEADFMDAIDSYLADCKLDRVASEKPYKGSFNVRISPKLHRKAALLAMEEKSSLNSFVAESIRERIIKETGDQKKRNCLR